MFYFVNMFHGYFIHDFKLTRSHDLILFFSWTDDQSELPYMYIFATQWIDGFTFLAIDCFQVKPTGNQHLTMAYTEAI